RAAATTVFRSRYEPVADTCGRREAFQFVATAEVLIESHAHELHFAEHRQPSKYSEFNAACGLHVERGDDGRATSTHCAGTLVFDADSETDSANYVWLDP